VNEIETSVRCLVIPVGAVFAAWGPPLVVRHFDQSPGSALAEAVQDAVGGFFELIQAPHNTGMYLNEDGKALGLAENIVATAIAHDAGLTMGDYIVGPVVIVGQTDAMGYETSVPDEFLAYATGLGCHIEVHRAEERPT
jgi:hypothetical protein